MLDLYCIQNVNFLQLPGNSGIRLLLDPDHI